MSCFEGLNFTGPCGSTIVDGFPTHNNSRTSAEVTIKFAVPSDKYCCFLRRLFGHAECQVQLTAPPIGEELSQKMCIKVQPWEFPGICASTLEEFRELEVPTARAYEPISVVSVVHGKGVVKCQQFEPQGDIGDDEYDENGFPTCETQILEADWMQKVGDWTSFLPSRDSVDVEDREPALLLVTVKFAPIRRTASESFRIRQSDYAPASELSALTLDVEVPPFEVDWPTEIEVRNNATQEARTLDSNELVFCDFLGKVETNCCKKVTEEARFFAPILRNEITIIWKNVICPPWKAIRELQGKVCRTAMFGYPAYSINYVGYNEQMRYNQLGQEVYDISYRFIAKTVPANGEMLEYEYIDPAVATVNTWENGIGTQMVLKGMVGAWGRSWCPVPMPNTTQHWQHVCLVSTGKSYFETAGWTGDHTFPKNDLGFEDLFKQEQIFKTVAP